MSKAEKKEMTDEQRLDAERKELNLLISRGMTFDLQRTVYEHKGGFLGWLKKRTPKIQELKFTISEPTLAILDHISAEQIDLVVDEKIMKSEEGMSQARKLTGKHSRRLAKIIALAVLGQDYIKMIPEGPRTRYEYDNKGLAELTDLFFHNIKPSKLIQLVVLINTMANLGDFINSIRLMSASRTTMPIRIEANKED